MVRHTHRLLYTTALAIFICALAQGATPTPRPSIAVFPFTVSATNFWDYYKEKDINLLTDKMNAALTQTRKFDVVERRRLDTLLGEAQLSATGLTDPARAVKTGKLIGANYLVFGSISIFETSTEHRKIPYTSKFNEIFSADMIVDIRVVDTETGKIVSVAKGDIAFRDKSMVDAKRNVRASSRILDDIQRLVAAQVTQKVIDGIYPLKISSHRDGTVYLNRGEGGGLKVGQLWEVHAPGKEIRDPDTGELLGIEEVKIGSIRVTQILAKFSKATVVAGAVETFPTGSICRLPKQKLPQDPGAPAARKLNW